MKRKQKPWSPEARQRHLEGVRRYQEERKDMELGLEVVTLARRFEVDVGDFITTLGVLHEHLQGTEGYPGKKLTPKKKEQAIDRLVENRGWIQELVTGTMKLIHEGIIPHPLEHFERAG